MDNCWKKLEPVTIQRTTVFTDVSERINPFPTHTPESVPFNIPPKNRYLSERINAFPTKIR